MRHRHVRILSLIDSPQRRLRHRLVWGGGLIAFGLALLLRNQGLLSQREVLLALPAVLAWWGLVRLAMDRSVRALLQLAVKAGVAALLVLVIEQVDGLTLAAIWPLLLIGVGVAVVLRPLVRGTCRATSEEPTW